MLIASIRLLAPTYVHNLGDFGAMMENFKPSYLSMKNIIASSYLRAYICDVWLLS